MLDPTVTLGDVPHAIQLALAPVFLLTGIAGMLNVMAGRLARIIDRGRKLTETALPTQPERRRLVELELATLERRRRFAGAAITACASAALLVCTVIAALFVEVYLQISLRGIVGLLFTGSTLALLVGLAYFLREVHLATQTVRITLHLPPQ
ncbi:hypothetical protein CLD22_19865 [Rubrivivax gelatinosus]|nr:hypothetical protein [Rubrivivax gelatinosus]